MESQFNFISPVRNALNVLQLINISGLISINKISNILNIPYSNTHRIVESLLSEGYIERDASQKKFYLIKKLSDSFVNNESKKILIKLVESEIMTLTRQVGWPIIFTKVEQDYVIVLSSSYSVSALCSNRYPNGCVVPLIYSSAGHVYMASLSPEKRASTLVVLYKLYEPCEQLNNLSDISYIKNIQKNKYCLIEKTQGTLNAGTSSSFSVSFEDLEANNYQLTLSFHEGFLSDLDFSKNIESLMKCVKSIKLKLKQNR